MGAKRGGPQQTGQNTQKFPGQTQPMAEKNPTAFRKTTPAQSVPAANFPEP